MINSRSKGNQYEVKICNEVKFLFPEVMTSRNGSKMIDDLKVDLLNTDPYAIQIKATERTPPYGMLLDVIEKNFPGLIPIIIHKRNYQGEQVIMQKQDFYNMLAKLQRYEKFTKHESIDELVKLLDEQIEKNGKD